MLEVLFSFIMAFGLSYMSTPIVIRVARQQGLLDTPDDRKAHKNNVPLFGGVSIFLSVLLVLLLWAPDVYFDELRYVLCALVIIFLVGAKDDIDPITPFTKLIGQLVTITILIVLADVRISQFYGLFGVQEIPYWLSVFISTLFFILVINSFNLIDGIDGLASSIAIIACALYGVWFFMTGQYSFCLLAFVVIGATVAFLRFNLTPAQIFMGDTGSMFLGTVCAVLTVKFMEHNSTITSEALWFEHSPAIALAILIVPIFDTIRVFVLRLRRGVSPFLPDRNHIHHLLLEAGLSHLQATMVLVTCTASFVFLAVSLSQINALPLMFSMLSVAWIMSIGLEQYITRRKRVLVRST